ncbi:hypothetical protein CK203_097802 [Vitis vinifera]|uniref:Reverse transcriptase zinc-binding domain-containing protein n=1 Tax=Vitis vinifera TaxID=29760 RepID=A0A438D537_VITVI|nr:hypothetical protein CK203_097802 [Vitis vinifera]
MCNCNYPPLLLVDKLVRRLLRPVGFLKSTLTFESKLLKLPPFLIDFNHVLETCAVLYTMPMSPVICAIFTYMSIYLDGRANTFPKEKSQIEVRADLEGFFCGEVGPLKRSLILFGGAWFALRRVMGVGGESMGRNKGDGVLKEARGVLWKSLRKDWDVVRSRLFFVVGNGQRYAWVKDVWCSNEGGGSWYRLMTGSWMRPSSLYPSSAIWKVYLQPRVSFFGWEATWGKALILDQLQKRGWALANKCYLCQRHEELINHILLHCVKTMTLWALLFSMFGVQWVLPATVKEMLLGWNGSFVGKKRKGVLESKSFVSFLDGLEGKEQNCLRGRSAVYSKA